MSTVEFYLNGEAVEASGYPPGMTVLRYLRTRAGLRGTKEGCASGDCGACTVLLAEAGEAPQAVNSCITLLGSVAGQHLVTVEGLSGADKAAADKTGVNKNSPALHPVQRAMVDCHGSQCGFCTPGFVMSLAALYAVSPSADEPAVRDAISGNLCRCTGYRPILEAGSSMSSYATATVMPDLSAQPELVTCDSAVDGFPDTGFCRPRSESELQAALTVCPEARLVAGGTDMVLEISQQYAEPTAIIDVSAVAELCRVHVDEDLVEVGAAATYSALEAALAHHSRPFLDMLHRLGSRQIRNRGTVGGNLAGGSPIADVPPVLLIWDALVEVVAAGGARRWCPVADFHIGYRETALAPGDYIAAVRIPRSSLARPHRIFKVSKRHEDDISTVLGAFSLALEDGRVLTARIAYGGMAAVPARVLAAEQSLLGQLLSDSAIDSACELVTEAFTPLDDVRASAAYRSAMAAQLLQRALRELRDGTSLSIDDLEPLAYA